MVVRMVVRGENGDENGGEKGDESGGGMAEEWRWWGRPASRSAVNRTT
jgi:hypothetical protein